MGPSTSKWLEDIADTIVFLCPDAARYIHGQTIEVNGGLLAP